MFNPTVLLASQSKFTVGVCKDIAAEMDIKLKVESKVEDFLLSLQENDYNAIMYDLDMMGLEALKAIRLIRNLRPKVPVITIASEVDKKFGGQILETGVFQLIMAPPSKEMVRSALTAITKM